MSANEAPAGVDAGRVLRIAVTALIVSTLPLCGLFRWRQASDGIFADQALGITKDRRSATVVICYATMHVTV